MDNRFFDSYQISEDFIETIVYRIQHFEEKYGIKPSYIAMSRNSLMTMLGDKDIVKIAKANDTKNNISMICGLEIYMLDDGFDNILIYN